MMLAYIGTTDLSYSKISMFIAQIKYVKNSTNSLRKTDYLQNQNATCTEYKTVHYLDITLDLNTRTCKSYHKPNEETLYVHAKSNQPANILKQLPISIKTRLSNLSSNPEICNEASKHYQNNLSFTNLVSPQTSIQTTK